MFTTIVLVLSILTPPQTPDISIQLQEPTIEACLADANEFLMAGGGLTREIKERTNAVAVKAACIGPTRIIDPT